jgi:hypothetical protein
MANNFSQGFGLASFLFKQRRGCCFLNRSCRLKSLFPRSREASWSVVESEQRVLRSRARSTSKMTMIDTYTHCKEEYTVVRYSSTVLSTPTIHTVVYPNRNRRSFLQHCQSDDGGEAVVLLLFVKGA